MGTDLAKRDILSLSATIFRKNIKNGDKRTRDLNHKGDKMKWHNTGHRGIRYRKHKTRKHGVRFDRYFTIRYQGDGKRVEEGLGWESDGFTLGKAISTLEKLKKAHKEPNPLFLNTKNKFTLKCNISRLLYWCCICVNTVCCHPPLFFTSSLSYL